MEEADIVATNPPFSLIRKYVATLMEYDKKFVILAPKNAGGYKDIFPYFMQNRIWYGHNDTTQRYFRVPAHYEFASEDTVKFDENGNKLASSDALWITNLETDKSCEDLLLFKNYTPEEYPKFENLDGINVDETKNIPLDYYGLMGVPISFLQKYNPNQFEIIGLRKGNDGRDLRIAGTNKTPYLRVIIKRKGKQP